MNTNLEQLRQVIIKAVPSIVELCFGCEFKIVDNPYNHVILDYVVPGIYITRYHTGEIEQIYKVDFIKDIELDRYKIIGRPIRLADVLVALGADGFVDKEKENNIMNCLVRWEFTDDNLTHQSPETINFLHKILVGEKE